jgi:hypothetical protein
MLLGMVVLAGCSAPTQKVAMQAEAIRNQQFKTVVDDMANIAKQQAVDLGVAQAQAAAAKSDPAAAQAAVESTVNTFERVGWLEREAVKARFGPGGIVDQYIWGTQGIFDILYRDWQKAEAKTAAAKPQTVE